jgi:hypothetical protein
MIYVLGVCLQYTLRMRNPERHNVAPEAAWCLFSGRARLRYQCKRYAVALADRLSVMKH